MFLYSSRTQQPSNSEFLNEKTNLLKNDLYWISNKGEELYK